jgi:3-oxoacyl-[acyl-carrier-protein] synthase III
MSAPTLAGGAAIAGVAEIPPARDMGDVTAMDLIARVARGAMIDAALTPGDVDGFLVAPTFAGAPVTVPSMVAEVLGIRPSYCDVVDLGGATAAGMVWRADRKSVV